MTQPKANISSKKNLISMTKLNAIANEKIARLISLHKKIETSQDKSEIAIALFEQKKEVLSLLNEARKGQAVMGLAAMKAMLITGMYFHRFYDYQAPYTDNRGYKDILKFSKFTTLAPLMMQYRTIEKADSIIPFVLKLPNLRKVRFSTVLFDTLNEVKKTQNQSFQNLLFTRLKKDYEIATPEEKTVIKNAFRISVLKGYPAAIINYLSILTPSERETLLPQTLKSIRFNKFAGKQELALLNKLAKNLSATQKKGLISLKKQKEVSL